MPKTVKTLHRRPIHGSHHSSEFGTPTPQVHLRNHVPLVPDLQHVTSVSLPATKRHKTLTTEQNQAKAGASNQCVEWFTRINYSRSKRNGLVLGILRF